eukprot:168290_1
MQIANEMEQRIVVMRSGNGMLVFVVVDIDVAALVHSFPVYIDNFVNDVDDADVADVALQILRLDDIDYADDEIDELVVLSHVDYDFLYRSDYWYWYYFESRSYYKNY